MIPKEPEMLLSYVNMKLRDRYASFEEMCEDMDLDPEEIRTILAGAGYRYDGTANRYQAEIETVR